MTPAEKRIRRFIRKQAENALDETRESERRTVDYRDLSRWMDDGGFAR